MILDCQKIEVVMILGNFHSIIELLIVDVYSIDLFKSRLDNFGCPKMLNMIRPSGSTTK